jgi:hypothetical protein
MYEGEAWLEGGWWVEVLVNWTGGKGGKFWRDALGVFAELLTWPYAAESNCLSSNEVNKDMVATRAY